MKIKNNITLALTAIGLAMAAAPSMSYEEGDLIVRARIITVDPQGDSEKVRVNGAATDSGVAVNSDTVPEVDFTYMIDKNWGTELILAYSKHTVSTTAGALSGLGDVADVKVLPPTLTLQYHFSPDSNIRPYLGAGINYTMFFDEKLTGGIKGLANKISLDDSWGLAAQAGLDVDINDTWFVNLDVKYIDMKTEANISGDNSIKVDTDIDPLVWGIGVGRVF